MQLIQSGDLAAASYQSCQGDAGLAVRTVAMFFNGEEIPRVSYIATDVVTGEMLTEIAEAFCDTVTAAGYRSIVYANTSQMLHMYDFEVMKDYDFWLDFPNMYYRFDMWQYTTDGQVDGIDAAVDLNLCFGAY